MKLKYVTFAIMVVNMLTMFGLLYFTRGLALDMRTITAALLDPYAMSGDQEGGEP